MPPGTSAAAGRFYEQMLGCSVRHSPLGSSSAVAVVCVGPAVHLCLSEGPDGEGLTNDKAEGMKGVHVAIYVAGFKRCVVLVGVGAVLLSPELIF